MPFPTTSARALATLAAVAALAATPTADAAAQVAAPAAPRYRFALAAGLNLAEMTETENSDMRTGFVVGAQAIIPLNRIFAFQPEIYYSQKGVKGSGEDPETGQTVDVALKHDYIELPILGRFGVQNATGVSPFLVLGPSFAFSMSCEFEGESQDVSVSFACDRLFEPSSFDFGGTLGGGIDIPMGTRALSLGVRYTAGLQEVFEDSDSMNRTITFLAGITF